MQILILKNPIIVLFLTLLFSGLTGQFTQGSAAELTDYSGIILAKINEARENPQAAMSRLDVSEQTAKDTFGDDAWVIDQGLPAVTLDVRLQTAAQAHGLDMIARGYYSHLSPSGQTPEDRVAGTGYQAHDVAETIAALDFDYYLAPEIALGRIVDNMILDELNGVPGVSRNIFSPTLTQVGIVFLADSEAFLSDRPYSYLLVLDFSLPESSFSRTGVPTHSYLVWQKINEARLHPDLAMARLAISRDQASAALGSASWVIDQGLPPLAWNDKLQTAAQDHVSDMFANSYYSNISSSGLDPEMRIDESGYDSQETSETMALSLASSQGDEDTIVNLLVDNMIRDELTGAEGTAVSIFSPTLTEVGFGYWSERLVELVGQEYASVVVADFGVPVEMRSFVIGQVDPGYSLVRQDYASGIWSEVEILPGDQFQFQHSTDGEDLLYWRITEADYVDYASTSGLNIDKNIDLDLRNEIK